MRSSSMARTVICCISFSRPRPTSAKTTTAAASKTECVFPSKYSMPSARSFRSSGQSACARAERGWDLDQTIAFAKELAESLAANPGYHFSKIPRRAPSRAIVKPIGAAEIAPQPFANWLAIADDQGLILTHPIFIRPPWMFSL
jgi:hypothetical protein